MKFEFLKKENHEGFYSLLYRIEPMSFTTSYLEPETHDAFMQPVPGKRVVEHHHCNTIRADFNAVGGHLTNLFLVTDTGLTLTTNDLDISQTQKQKIWSDFFDGIEALRRVQGPQVVIASVEDLLRNASERSEANGNRSEFVIGRGHSETKVWD